MPFHILLLPSIPSLEIITTIENYPPQNNTEPSKIEMRVTSNASNQSNASNHTTFEGGSDHKFDFLSIINSVKLRGGNIFLLYPKISNKDKCLWHLNSMRGCKGKAA